MTTPSAMLVMQTVLVILQAVNAEIAAFTDDRTVAGMIAVLIGIFQFLTQARGQQYSEWNGEAKERRRSGSL